MTPLKSGNKNKLNKMNPDRQGTTNKINFQKNTPNIYPTPHSTNNLS